MDLAKIKKVYMIGVKGVGMTMLAQFLVGQGYEVSGSDTAEIFMTDQILAKYGIKVNQGFNAENIPADADLIIYSSAYNSQTNTEVEVALNSGVKILTYAEVLGEIFNQKYGIAVCGSHGKTTTTAWLGYVMMREGLKPNVMVGARVPQFDSAGLIGDSDYLIIEADEYQNKLKYYNPKAVLLNNIDHDHHDFFPTSESYAEAFIEFIKKIPKKGFLIANFDDQQIASIANVNCHGKVISYALNREDVNFFAYNIKQQGLKEYFKVKMDGEDIGDFSISLLGQHNVSNALAVIAISIELGIELKDIRTYLEEFSGTDRRMSIMGKFKGAIIIDDYGHHPTEIKATLNGLRGAYPKNKITVIFHPHTFTRTKALLEEFAKSFSEADKIIVLDIYGSAREIQGGVSSADLVEKIKVNEPSKQVLNIHSLPEAEQYLRANVERDEVVVLMGAGDVFRVGENLLK